MNKEKTNNTSESNVSYIENNNSQLIKMPVFSSIPAGVPIESVKNIESYLYVNSDRLKNNLKEYFLLRINDDSMEDTYKKGDVILCHINPSPKSGSDCAVTINNTTIFRQVNIFDDKIELRPYNKKYESITYTSAEIQSLPITILGEAISLEYRNLKNNN